MSASVLLLANLLIADSSVQMHLVKNGALRTSGCNHEARTSSACLLLFSGVLCIFVISCLFTAGFPFSAALLLVFALSSCFSSVFCADQLLLLLCPAIASRTLSQSGTLHDSNRASLCLKPERYAEEGAESKRKLESKER